MNRNKELTLLDCTFRDGGYYNQWDFNAFLVKKYLYAMANANIDVIELGFRNFPQETFLGAFAYTTDAYIDLLNIDSRILIGVMVDARSILNSNLSIADSIRVLFQVKKKSRVDLVRIATHFSDIDQCFEIAKELKEMGYRVGLNLMQPNVKTNNELSKVAKLVQNWRLIDVLYFADSLGGMENIDVVRIISSLRVGWSGDTGFHAHNNKGLAVSNALVAIENGATWIDCTILGMGRGAGNAQTENLLLELLGRYPLPYKPDALFDLVLSDFTPLRQYYHWGSSLLYSLAAINNIHPTYIQEMIADNRYSNKEILQAINFMSTLDASHYDEGLLLHTRNDANNKGSWNAKNWCSGKEVLILGSGKSLDTYQDAIIQYIKKYQPMVISLNIQLKFPEEFIDVYVSSNESKMLVEYTLYKELSKPLIISNKLLSRTLNRTITSVKKMWDYGLNIAPDTLIINEKECTLPYELSIGYALSLACVGNATSINLVGFDGYKDGDARQVVMNEIFELFKEQSIQAVTTLTPSSYNISQGSIYAGKY